MRLALVLGLVAALVAASPAAARQPFRSLGAGSAWTDGERYVAINPSDNNLDRKPLRVIDDVTGRTWQLAPPRLGCTIYDVAAGNVLWNCWSGDPLLQELDSTVARPVPGWDTYLSWLTRYGYSFGQPSVHALGSTWLEVGRDCYHCTIALSYIDWHTGTFVSAASELKQRTVDLDSADFDVPLCAPLSRLRYQDSEGIVPFAPSRYEPPWFLRRVMAPGTHVRLYHCGKSNPLLVARCKLGDCLSRQLGGGHLTWRDGYRVYDFNLRSRKRRLVGLAPGTLTMPGIWHTRRTVYASGSGKVYAAPMPHR
jgi:hypothetical protein